VSEHRLTKLQRKVLIDAIDDGGVVQFLGLDKHPEYNGYHIRAACALAVVGYGSIEEIPGTMIMDGQFRINDHGRAALRQK